MIRDVVLLILMIVLACVSYNALTSRINDLRMDLTEVQESLDDAVCMKFGEDDTRD